MAMSRSAPAVSAAQRRASETASREAWAIVMQFVQAAKQTFLTEFDLTPAQAHLLMQLDPANPEPMSDVANTLGCDASNVTGLVDRLEQRGLIERRAASDDRRVKMVAVTAAGSKLRTKLRDRWYDAPGPLARLPEHDAKELLKILRKAAAEG